GRGRRPRETPVASASRASYSHREGGALVRPERRDLPVWTGHTEKADRPAKRRIVSCLVRGVSAMRQVTAICVVGVLFLAASSLPRAAASRPEWPSAIPPAPPAGAPPAAPPDTSPKQLPGSTLTFTRQQISDGFGPADWFPGDHPRMPEI